jgi:hypothetical protein
MKFAPSGARYWVVFDSRNDAELDRELIRIEDNRQSLTTIARCCRRFRVKAMFGDDEAEGLVTSEGRPLWKGQALWRLRYDGRSQRYVPEIAGRLETVQPRGAWVSGRWFPWSMLEAGLFDSPDAAQRWLLHRQGCDTQPAS